MKYLSRILASNHRSDGIHVLCYSEAWGQGGVETFLMSIFRRWQGKGFYFTLFSCWDWNLALDAELDALGIDRFTVFPDSKPGQVKRLCEGSAAFGALINEIRPDAVYVNTMNGMGFLYSEVAQKHGVPVRVVHSHNSAFGSGQAVVKAVMHSFGRAAFGGSATVRLACSADAGHYLFGARPFEVVNNGIDTSRFAFDPAARTEIRSRFGIPQDTVLFGSVGRIAEAKNPLFQIRTFAEVLRAVPGAYYLMVGDGDMKDQVKALIRELGINDRVIMPGYLPDPAPFTQPSIASLCPPYSKVLPLCALRLNARDAGLCAPRLSLLRPM